MLGRVKLGGGGGFPIAKEARRGSRGGHLQGKASEGTEQKKEKKRTRMKKLLTKPIQPPNPEHKGTALHLRLTYRELQEGQVATAPPPPLPTKKTLKSPKKNQLEFKTVPRNCLILAPASPCSPLHCAPGSASDCA